MKWETSVVALLATLALAAPQQKAASGVNDAANNGQGGISAAAKAEAAVILSQNGDAGAVDSGAAFDDAVKQVASSGSQQDLQTLKDAGLDVNAALGNGGGGGGGGNQGQNNGQNKGQKNQGQAQAKGQAQQAQGQQASKGQAQQAQAKGQ